MYYIETEEKAPPKSLSLSILSITSDYWWRVLKSDNATDFIKDCCGAYCVDIHNFLKSLRGYLYKLDMSVIQSFPILFTFVSIEDNF